MQREYILGDTRVSTLKKPDDDSRRGEHILSSSPVKRLVNKFLKWLPRLAQQAWLYWRLSTSLRRALMRWTAARTNRANPYACRRHCRVALVCL